MNEQDIAIRLTGVKKRYKLGQIGGGTLTADLQSWWARVRGKEDPNLPVNMDQRLVGQTFMALNGVDLTVHKGEALGIIGCNGAGKSTLLKLLCRVFRPLFSFLFPKCRKNPRASEALCASFCANLIGLGNAATPLGIAAMRAMAAPEARGWASDDMILFAVLNTTAFSLLPTNLLSLRRAAGSADPFLILAPVWLCSAIGCIFAVFLCRLLACLSRSPGKPHPARSEKAAVPARRR